MIDAMPRIAAEVPGAVLVVAGAGPEEENLKRQAVALGANVTVLGDPHGELKVLEEPDTSGTVADRADQDMATERAIHDAATKDAQKGCPRVIFAGRVPEEEAPAYFALADVFTLAVADRYFGREVEGLGVVMLEAAACGTPSVIGASGGSPETVIDGETGRVIDARDRAALASALSDALADRDAATSMGAKAREFVSNEFATAPLPESLLEWINTAK